MDDPRSALLMGLATGLLTPTRGGQFAPALSQGLMGGMQGYQTARQMQGQRELMDMRKQEAAAEAAYRAQQAQYTADDRAQAQQDRARAEAARAAIEADLMQRDPTGRMLSMYRIDPKAAAERMFPKMESPFNKIDQKDYTPESVRAFAQSISESNPAGDRTLLAPRSKAEFVNGVAVDPYAVKPGAVIPNANQPFMLTQSEGGYKAVPNVPYQNYEMSKASAGATRVNVPVSVSTERKFGETLAGEIGKAVASGRDAAQAAQGTLGTIDRVIGALDSGKILAGPGTAPVLLLRQVGQVIGVGGKSNEEILQNTRTAIQGLAQMSVDGAKQLAGQGQLTDYERRLIERAASGDIGSMTLPELRTLMAVQRKASMYTIKAHEANVERLKGVEGATPLVPFFQVTPPVGPSDDPLGLRGRGK